MAKVTAAEFADKWGRRLNAAGPDIQAGINRVSEAPGMAAARQADLWLQKIQQSVETWKKNVSSVPLDEWKAAMINKGMPRIAAGVATAQKTKLGVFGDLLAAVDTAVAETNRQPRGTLEQNIQRAVTFMQSMSRNAPKKKK